MSLELLINITENALEITAMFTSGYHLGNIHQQFKGQFRSFQKNVTTNTPEITTIQGT